MEIGKDTVVAIDYTLTDTNGAVIDTSNGHEPLTYLHGAGSITPGLEKALEGKSAGESLTVSIGPEKGYGLRNDAMVQSVSRNAFGDAKVEPGMQFRAEGQNAGSRVITVVSVEGDDVRIDANHPLAGQTLNFDVKIISVRAATAQEISHRHVHGPGGHHH
ncbi:MAG TPA: peptidylprolyl isomerase [Tepidisphaeraceae bacterium]|nr:peptidylprolyl isomerase [Tepidisphaeraceae bacterium]